MDVIFADSLPTEDVLVLAFSFVDVFSTMDDVGGMAVLVDAWVSLRGLYDEHL